MMRLKYFLSIYFFLGPLTGTAQDFQIQSFSLLENDLSARANPVFDLRGDPCALIKMVPGKEIEVDGPLGVVKRVDKAVESLLYVPVETKHLTFSHTQYGVIRNYLLPLTLNAKSTYELRLKLPNEVQIIVVEKVDTVYIHQPAEVEKKPLKQVRKEIPTHWGLLGLLSMGKALGVGGTFVFMGRWGGYVSYQSNWNQIQDQGLECNRDGQLASGLTPFYKSTSSIKEYSLTMGLTAYLVDYLYLYAGAGYGAFQKYWKTIDGDNVLNKDLSTKGLATDIGMMLYFKHFVGQVGVQTIGFKEFAFVVGLGYVF